LIQQADGIKSKFASHLKFLARFKVNNEKVVSSKCNARARMMAVISNVVMTNDRTKPVQEQTFLKMNLVSRLTFGNQQ
jgi:hypothetical protein